MAVKVAGKQKWRWVPGYEGYYRISSFGAVRSVDRVVAGQLAGTTQSISGKILTPRKGQYLVATLARLGKVKLWSVHRLVAMAFIPNPDGLAQVNHKDGDKYNNHADNLEWATSRQNIRHSVKLGLHPVGSRNGNSKLTESDVRTIRLRISAGEAPRVVAKAFGITMPGLWLIRTGRTWAHLS